MLNKNIQEILDKDKLFDFWKNVRTKKIKIKVDIWDDFDDNAIIDNININLEENNDDDVLIGLPVIDGLVERISEADALLIVSTLSLDEKLDILNEKGLFKRYGDQIRNEVFLHMWIPDEFKNVKSGWTEEDFEDDMFIELDEATFNV